MSKKDNNSDFNEGNTLEVGRGRASHLAAPNPPELTVRIIFIPVFLTAVSLE
jgi:hypothetical protein